MGGSELVDQGHGVRDVGNPVTRQLYSVALLDFGDYGWPTSDKSITALVTYQLQRFQLVQDLVSFLNTGIEGAHGLQWRYRETTVLKPPPNNTATPQNPNSESAQRRRVGAQRSA